MAKDIQSKRLNISLVKDLNGGPSGSLSMDRTISAARENELIFSTTTPPAVWRTDGTNAGTLQLAASVAREIVTAGTMTYFITGNELWKTDGTSAGTVMVKNITAGLASTIFSSPPG